jgi:hypothetical protein
MPKVSATPSREALMRSRWPRTPWGCGSRAPDLVASAAALFEPAQPWAHGPDRRGEEPDSGRFRITVGPGVVRLGWTNPVRAERHLSGQSTATGSM